MDALEEAGYVEDAGYVEEAGYVAVAGYVAEVEAEGAEGSSASVESLRRGGMGAHGRWVWGQECTQAVTSGQVRASVVRVA